MVRTIDIVFFGEFGIKKKNYRFLCNYDIVKEGDIITDPRYSSDMIVVNITEDTNRVQNGLTLKDIYITFINNIPVKQPSGLVYGSVVKNNCDSNKQETNNNMETRNISITIEQAFEWYTSDNDTLKTLALSAYTKDELELNYSIIKSNVNQSCKRFNTPIGEITKFQVLTKLATIAKYYNKEWKKTSGNTGYFIGKHTANNSHVVNISDDIGIYQHNTVQYAGIVYFKNQNDAVKAVKILGEEIKELF